MSYEFEPEDRLDLDDDGLVYNTLENYRLLASDVWYDRSVIIAWSDEQGTQLDVSLVLIAKEYGSLQGGQSTGTDLFVGVSQVGFFGFDMFSGPKSGSYVAEKLNLEDGHTARKLAQLINGVQQELVPIAGL